MHLMPSLFQPASQLSLEEGPGRLTPSNSACNNEQLNTVNNKYTKGDATLHYASPFAFYSSENTLVRREVRCVSIRSSP